METIDHKIKSYIHRSIRNMFEKELIHEFRVKWGKDKPSELFGYILTEKGFNVLKLTNYEHFKNINFKDYFDRFNEWKDDYFSGYEKLVEK